MRTQRPRAPNHSRGRRAAPPLDRGRKIARDVVPEFAPDFQRVSVHEGSHAPAAVEARKFRARAARLVAANYTHRFAACDTSRFYPNATRNEV